MFDILSLLPLSDVKEDSVTFRGVETVFIVSF